jgi:hypothetical protein
MFLRTIHLTLFQGLPYSRVLKFDEQDPTSALHTRALNITGRTLRAQIDARPKAKAYGIELPQDPPEPGVYVFLVMWGGSGYPLEIELLPGELAKDLQAKIIAAIKELHLGLSACPEKCSNAHEIIVAAPWPGLDWTLDLTGQPEGGLVDVEVLQDNAPLVEFTVSSEVIVDQLAVTLSLTAAQTGVIPAAGDGPYRWRLTAPAIDGEDIDPDDQLLLAHGLVTIGRA